MAGMLREARGRMRAAALMLLLVWGGGVQAQGPAVPAAPAQGVPAATPAQAADGPPPVITADAGPPGETPSVSPDLSRKIEDLRNLLADPDIRAALAAAGPPEEGPPEMTEMEEDFDIWITQIRAHLWAVIEATRDLPEDLSQGAANAVRAIDRGGWLRFLLSLAVLLGGAFAVEALCRRLLRRPAALHEGGSPPPPGEAAVPPGSAPSMVMPASAPWPPTVDDPAKGEAGAAVAAPASAAGDTGAAPSTTDAPAPMVPAGPPAAAPAGQAAAPPIPGPPPTLSWRRAAPRCGPCPPPPAGKGSRSSPS